MAKEQAEIKRSPKKKKTWSRKKKGDGQPDLSGIDPNLEIKDELLRSLIRAGVQPAPHKSKAALPSKR